MYKLVCMVVIAAFLFVGCDSLPKCDDPGVMQSHQLCDASGGHEPKPGVTITPEPKLDCSDSRLQGAHAARAVRPVGMWIDIPNSVFDQPDAGSLTTGDRVIMVPGVAPQCLKGVMWWRVEFGRISAEDPLHYRATDGWVPESEGGGYFLEPEGQSVAPVTEIKDYSWLLTSSINIADRTTGTIGETCNSDDVCLEGPASVIHYQRLIHKDGYAELYVCGLPADYEFIWTRVLELAKAGNIDNAANQVSPSVGCDLAVKVQGGENVPDYEIWVTASGGIISYTTDPPSGMPYEAVYGSKWAGGLYHNRFDKMGQYVVQADANLWVHKDLLNSDGSIKNDGPIPGLAQGTAPQPGQYDEARVRIILADIELGGPYEYYADKTDPASIEAIARWNRGVRVANIDQFQRKIVTIGGEDQIAIVIAGTDQFANGLDVQLTK